MDAFTVVALRNIPGSGRLKRGGSRFASSLPPRQPPVEKGGPTSMLPAHCPPWATRVQGALNPRLAPMSRVQNGSLLPPGGDSARPVVRVGVVAPVGVSPRRAGWGSLCCAAVLLVKSTTYNVSRGTGSAGRHAFAASPSCLRIAEREMVLRSRDRPRAQRRRTARACNRSGSCDALSCRHCTRSWSLAPSFRRPGPRQ